MKQIIKIMKERPQLSDEEIRSYMNFDRLLADRKQAIKPKFHLVKWIIPAITVIGVATWLILDQFNNTDVSDSPINPEQVVPNVEHQTESAPISPETNTTSEEKGNSTSAKSVSPEVESSQKTVAVQKQPEETERVEPSASQIYVQAEPVDGYSALYAYFNSNLIYPKEAIKDSIQGIETVSFVINAEGKPENITIKQSLGEPFEKEARRLIENMPSWKPATIGGKPVPSQMSVPLTFQIQKVKVNR